MTDTPEDTAAPGEECDPEPTPPPSRSITLPTRAPAASTVGAFARPFAEARVLAAFLTEETLRAEVPNLEALPGPVRAALNERLGRASALRPDPTAGRPRFERVEDVSALEVVADVARASPQPASLNNLVGFEWVEIGPLLAGRLVTPALPEAYRVPPPEDEPTVARFCMYSFTALQGRDLVIGNQFVSTPVRVALEAQPPQVDRSSAQIVARYAIRPLGMPIRVLLVDGIAIATEGIERLVALVRRGVRRALCAVSYGYGIEACLSLPRTPPEILALTRPPTIQDLAEDDLAVSIPVRTPAMLTRFSAESILVGG